jgi:hypothetical protein
LKYYDQVCYVRGNGTTIDSAKEVPCTLRFMGSCGRGLCAETQEDAYRAASEYCPKSWMLAKNDMVPCRRTVQTWQCCDALETNNQAVPGDN